MADRGAYQTRYKELAENVSQHTAAITQQGSAITRIEERMENFMADIRTQLSGLVLQVRDLSVPHSPPDLSNVSPPPPPRIQRPPLPSTPNQRGPKVELLKYDGAKNQAGGYCKPNNISYFIKFHRHNNC
ncbi:hypothetical protein Pint_24658 [Pistacia integerrima]|uniref:Uncharacterized protein n=1 Tax=Pistacia integerrima TaxID=434235 RepID=A0ACC0YIU5_9ROSI|nr:hypothetical protein Pint_24658 [Pistacia integerrima]